MNFWNFCFSYILKGYWNRGEKRSGHIYALSILTLLPTINLLSIFFIAFTDSYLKSENFKVIIICIFVLILGINSYTFVFNKKYLEIFPEYSSISKVESVKKKVFFWAYFSVSIAFLILSMSF